MEVEKNRADQRRDLPDIRPIVKLNLPREIGLDVAPGQRVFILQDDIYELLIGNPSEKPAVTIHTPGKVDEDFVANTIAKVDDVFRKRQYLRDGKREL
jgi:hypothetical protein